MYSRAITAAAMLLAAQASACVQDPEETAPLVEQDQATRSAVTRLAAGKNLVVLGVTEDDFVLHWNGSTRTVWATPLAFPALQLVVARDVAAAPLALVRGRVVMIWTAQPFLGVIQGVEAVSPLVVWTARTGPRLASTASLAPQLFSIQAAAAVRPDDREVVFTSNVSADGSTGDVVRASTDLKQVTTLLSGIELSQGPCPPHVGYDRVSSLGAPRVLVSSCPPGGSSAATLSRWTGDRRVDLTTSMRAGGWWTSDERGEHVLVQLADNSPAVFTLDDAMTIVSTRKTATGWITRDGTVFQTPLTADRTAREIYRIPLAGAAPEERVTTLPPVSGLQFPNHLPFGVSYANVSTVPTTRSGAFLVAFSAFNDNLGLLTDSLRIDARARDAAPVASSATAVSLPAFELATRDERFNLFHVFAADDLNRSTLFAGTATGEARQVSQGQTTLGIFALGGSRIAFADHVTAPILDGNIDATGDLVTLDVSSPSLAPTVLARGARAHFFVTASRDAVVYSTDADAGPGLYVRRLGR
jgi:hypothetical protein